MNDIIEILTRDTNRLKEYALKKRMIDYYNTTNQGKVSIPSFMLAQEEINRIKAQGTYEYFARKAVI